MLGLQDKWVVLVFVLCIASSVLCVVYAWLNWNKGDETPRAEDAQWAAEEKKVEENL